MSLIIYNKNESNNLYGIKQIDEKIFKKLLYSKIHKKCKFIISKNKIENEFNIKLETTNENLNIILMPELTENQLKNYLEIYETPTESINKYMEFLSIIIYNQINPERFEIKKKLNSLISEISDYWENPRNCNYTLTNDFIDRKFKSLNNEYNNNLLSNKNNFNYLNDIIRNNIWTKTFLKNYNIPNISSLTNNDVTNLYKQLLSENQKYIFICNMLCSRANCHLILNNYELLCESKPIFIKYKIIFKYLIGYSWITFINEEYNIYKKISDNDRIIFDINTVNILPKFPFTWDDINQNPYAVLLINSNVLDIKNNCLSLNMMKNYEKYYGVCDSDEFSRRLNIFVNSRNIKGILDDIDWSCCVISGSVMTACGMKYNPLFDISKISNNPEILTDDDLANYFFQYYLNSDVDLICNKKSIIDFINVVKKFVISYRKITNDIKIENIHTGILLITDDLILMELENIKNKTNLNKINFEFIKLNLSNEDIKSYFYDKYYVQWKLEQINIYENHEDELFKEYFKPISKDEFKITFINYELNEKKIINQDNEKYIYFNNKLIGKISESIRYKIKSQNIRTFEIFKSKDENFFSMISKFHMGFVRALWNGKTVLCLPSYISSMMIQLSIDYKYFSSMRNPIEIINKYRSRGFGIILNDHEKLNMAYYNSFKNKDSDINLNWIKMYKINVKLKESIKNIFGAKLSSDDIFKPSKFFSNLPDDCYANPNHHILTTFDDCFNSLITPSLKYLCDYKAINDNGKINPLIKEVITMGYNTINNIK